jgi:hypothetical protein
MKCSHVMINIDDTYMYKGIESLFLDSSYKVVLQSGPTQHGPVRCKNSLGVHQNENIYIMRYFLTM